VGGVLFAGAAQSRTSRPSRAEHGTSLVASVGSAGLAAVVGGPTYVPAASWVGLSLLRACVRALISPTDPVPCLGPARVSQRRARGADRRESLFNDGWAVAVSPCCLDSRRLGACAAGSARAAVAIVSTRELAARSRSGSPGAWIAYELLRSVDEYNVGFLLTLGPRAGALQASPRRSTYGPLAVGGPASSRQAEARARQVGEADRAPRVFWELVDEILTSWFVRSASSPRPCARARLSHPGRGRDSLVLFARGASVASRPRAVAFQRLGRPR